MAVTVCTMLLFVLFSCGVHAHRVDVRRIGQFAFDTRIHPNESTKVEKYVGEFIPGVDSALAEIEEASNVMTKDFPVIYNRCNMPLAVYLERGFLFNRQVIQPGEAARLWSPFWGPNFAPYSIIAIVGDETALPSSFDSMLHFVGKAAVPTAFVGGVALSIWSWGALTGPSVALAPLVAGPAGLGAIKVTTAAGAVWTLGVTDLIAGTAAAKAAEELGEYAAAEAKKNIWKKYNRSPPISSRLTLRHL